MFVCRQQLAQVIEKHNQVLAEREQEIFRASTEEIDEDDQVLDSRRFKISSVPKNRNQNTKVNFIYIYTELKCKYLLRYLKSSI